MTRREAGVAEPARDVTEVGRNESEFDSAIHGVILYLMALALAFVSVSVHADTSGKTQRTSAAKTYVALHLQHYTGICPDNVATRTGGQSSVCLHEAAIEPAKPAKPVMRASLNARGVN